MAHILHLWGPTLRHIQVRIHSNHCLKQHHTLTTYHCHLHCIQASHTVQSDHTKMALSPLTFTTPRAQASQIFTPKLSSTVKPTSTSSYSSVSATKKAISNMGIGLLAASVLALSPLDANATRIEYYATVGEPLCEFNYVPSGLGYCDIAVGSGEEVPYGELINVSSNLQLSTCFSFYFSSHHQTLPWFYMTACFRPTSPSIASLQWNVQFPPLRCYVEYMNLICVCLFC